jgi:membrane protease YdiL (CAAX protease family)
VAEDALNFEPDHPEVQLSESPALLPPTPRNPTTLEAMFLGSDGLRAGWRVLVYFAFLIVIYWLVSAGLHFAPFVDRVGAEAMAGHNSAASLLLQEVPAFVTMLLASWVMTFIEKRPLWRYGLPLHGAFGSRFWQGAAWGFLQLTVLLGVIHLLGGFSFGTLALHGTAIVQYALLYSLAFLFVGLSEEYLLRGYLQYTLSRGIGFWPAAVITSSLFAAIHLFNSGENPLGIAMVAIDGLFGCFILWRTGNLWWAVGNHAAWDFSQSYLYSVSDSGQNVSNHLMNSNFHGPAWLTGGSVGPEGSVFIPGLFAISFVVFHFCYPKREYSDVS